jgi:DnaK suppressor protein
MTQAGMNTHLTPAQHALLETELQLARRRIEQALQAQLEGGSRVTHAAQLLADDPHDAREHDAERALDFARSDHLQAELREIDAALQRLNQPGYGQCQDCGSTIPFDRLVRQPQAECCVACQTVRETDHAH